MSEKLECPKCKTRMIVESVDTANDVKRVRCQKCGHTEVRDERGRQMLTETIPYSGKAIGG